MGHLIRRLVFTVLGLPPCGHRTPANAAGWCVDCWLRDAADLI